MIDDEIRRALKLLETLMTISGLNRQEVDRRLGQGRGYASQVLTGRVELKYRHVLAFLEVVDVDPGVFFRVLFPDAAEERRGTGGQMLERLFRQLHRAGYGDRLEPAAPPSATLLTPATPANIDPEMLERRIREAIREVLGSVETPGGPAGPKDDR
jgi:hypothetical protein